MPKGIPDTHTLTDEQQEIALELVLSNKTHSQIAKQLGFTTDMQFWRYRQRHPLFEQELKSVRQFAAEILADSTLTLVDDYPNPLQARVKFEIIKWVCATRYPEVYGERLDVNVNQTIDIGGALAAALARTKTVFEIEPQYSQALGSSQSVPEDEPLPQTNKTDQGV